MTSRVRHTLTRNIEFIDAVTHGDEDAARWALEAGADVNATDAAGRSSVACAITGESWKTVDASDASFMTTGRLNVLRLLVEHQHISLYSLNAPQDAMNGVTPLGMASWLNAPDVVHVLLDSSSGAVAVNGMDAHGVTALMYASRDGNLDVIKSIVSAGGRPDFRDRHHRTSVQYSLDHPQVLWVCEEALRRHRAQECQSGNARQLSLVAQVDIDLKHEATSHEIQNYPPTHLFSPTDILTNTNALVKCIITADIPVLQSLLFPPPLISSDASPASLATPAPVLVNKPDAEDWSPIHYCTSVRQPSIEVLDILYRAGADVSLFSRTGNCTPLHCLARRKRGADSLRGSESSKILYQFVVHLVRDLDAPLAALDLNKDTCIHVAAEHGDSAEVLRALLDCDKDGSVRETKNSRGLTALEIAKPEFRIVFGVLDEHLRPESSASLLTVRPLHSYSSVPSLASVASDVASIRLCSSPVSPVSPITSVSSPIEDPTSASQRLIRNLRFISHELEENPESAVSDLDRLQTVLKQTAVQSTHLLSQLRSRITDVRDELSGAHDNWAKTDSMLDAVAQTVDEKLKRHRVVAEKRPSGEFYGRQRSDTTVSADSQTTAVGSESDELASAKPAAPGHRGASPRLNASTSHVLDLAEPKNGEIHDDLLASWPSWLDPFEAKVRSPLEPQFGQETGSPKGHSRLKASKSMIDLRRTSISPVKAPSTSSSDPPRTRPRADTIAGGMKNPSETAKDGETSSAARLKAWFKRKLKPERPERPAKPVPELPPARSSTEPRSSLTTLCEQDEHAAESPCKKEFGDQENGSEKVLHFSYRPLAAAGKDMARIDESMTNAGKYVASAYRSLVQAEQIIKRALKRREALIQEHRSAHSVDAGLAAVLAWEPSSVPSIDISTATPFPSRARSDSSASAHSSVASALTSSSSEGEDDDVKQLHRLLTRKTEARIDEASYQVERVDVWLRVVQDVLRGVETHNPLSDGGVDHGHVDQHGQALDPHLSQVGLDSRQHYHGHYPPPHVLPPDASQAHHPEHLAFYQAPPHDLSAQAVERQQGHSAPKRKQVEGAYPSSSKKRRQSDATFDAEGGEEGEGGEGEGNGSGARHWTDDEKTKLFTWLMGAGEDEHFDALRTKKNTCFRDCALDAFGGRKTFLAVKGCYERNFVVFKQIYAFETFTSQMQRGTVDTESEVDRLREYERRIYAARKAGFHVGNLTSRLLDHWHRMGWYNTFYSRWNGDPGIRKPPGRARTMGPPSAPAMHPQSSSGDSHIEPSLRGETPLPMPGPSQDRAYEQDNTTFAPQEPEPMMSPPQTPGPPPAHQPYAAPAPFAMAPHTAPPPPQPGASIAAVEQTVASMSTMAQTMMSACMRLLQAQAEDSKARLDYLKRREEREVEEGRLRMELEKKRQERENADRERMQQNAKLKQKSDLATEILSNPGVEASVKQAAGDYLKKLFAND
ncbi:hypothetical protein EWM64_g7338 [Hericium alpestre]|uniref:Ankyrin n=1 Tax=Hericium alpestre TaxID=135208 RepID=A0A4Y9ZP64_9AGAM|nr:hypothetical protein EWM64_g7338 [Hericium alpestre]